MPPKKEPVEVVADEENDEYATKKEGGPYVEVGLSVILSSI